MAASSGSEAVWPWLRSTPTRRIRQPLFTIHGLTPKTPQRLTDPKDCSRPDPKDCSRPDPDHGLTPITPITVHGLTPITDHPDHGLTPIIPPCSFQCLRHDNSPLNVTSEVEEFLVSLSNCFLLGQCCCDPSVFSHRLQQRQFST